jgi:LAGLIDADG DNA endonuclease family protein/SNF2 domain-containing protein
MHDTYADFLASKKLVAPAVGVDVAPEQLHPALFPFQRDLVRWSLRKGRAALFEDCGLGKTIQSLAWAEHAAERVLILAPLAVAQQTVREGERFGIPVSYVRHGDDAPERGIAITNYEMLSHFDPAAFGAVVLDESAILKDFNGRTRTALIEAFQHTPMRLCCTATPAPNDIQEIANHCLPYHSVIRTRDGNREIGDIVRKREPVEVLSFDGHQLVWARVTNWSRRPNPEGLWRIQWGRGGKGASLLSTQCHPILTRHGWTPAGDVLPGDEVAIAAPSFSSEQEEVILGTLLGDSWLRTLRGWPSLISCHSKPQWEYLDWMANALGAKTFDVTPRPGGVIEGRQIVSQPQRRFRTPQSPALWGIWQLAYVEGKKRVTRAWLDRIGPLGLAVWAMDDGTTRTIRYSREARSCNCKRGAHKKSCSTRGAREMVCGYHFVFNTDGFSLEERALIVTWLKERFGLDVIASGGKKIVLTRESTRHFREIVAPYITLGDHAKEWLSPPVERGQENGIVWLPVASSCAEPGSGGGSVYDIEVEETHNFVMGSGLVVHNSEFLGVMTRVEMLAHFFIHDSDGWRLKGHSRKAFFRWLASWGMAVKKPSDIGGDDTGYDLPPLVVTPHFIDTEFTPTDCLFAVGLKGVTDRAKVRRGTLSARVEAAAALVQSEPREAWLLWCGLNDEGYELKRLLPDATLVEGSQSPDEKAAALLGFATSEVKTLLTKPGISGHGMNYQHCARMAFVGLGDSFEAFYQSVRRCWRFGQTRPVHVHVILSELERDIWANVMRKQSEADRLSHELIENASEFAKSELAAVSAGDEYHATQEMALPDWLRGGC